MKNKNLLIVILCLGAAALMSATFLAAVFISGSNMASVHCYVADNGAVYMLYNDRLIGLTDTDDVKMSSGDKAFVIFGSSFAESFPESTQAHYIVKISDGDPEDIVLDNSYRSELESLGFVFE